MIETNDPIIHQSQSLSSCEKINEFGTLVKVANDLELEKTNWRSMGHNELISRKILMMSWCLCEKFKKIQGSTIGGNIE